MGKLISHGGLGNWLCLFFALAGGRLLAAEVALSTSAADIVPRYKFVLGQELVYERTTSEDVLNAGRLSDSASGQAETRSKWWVWVTRKNPDSWRLVIRKRIERTMTATNDERLTEVINDFLSYLDLKADGAYPTIPTLGGHPYFKLWPSDVFIELPATAEQLSSGWSFTSPVENTKQSFRMVGAEGNLLTFTGPMSQIQDKARQVTTVRTVDFDVVRGLITKIVTELKSELPPAMHRRVTFELTGLETHYQQWIANFSKEADAYCAAVNSAEKDFNAATRSRGVDECRTLLESARTALTEARKKSTLPEMQELLDARVKSLASDESTELQTAAFREKVYELPPAQWTTTDLAGVEYTLDDFRGKVVVMDFWYRNCPHCILAFPKIKQLASQYKNSDVVVMGINNDRKIEDAQFIVTSYGLDYLNLRAGDIPTIYGVRLWPTLIVLDQAGRVAALEQGNTEDLLPYVTEVVDRLLADPATVEATAAAPWKKAAVVIGALGILAVAIYLILNRRAQIGTITSSAST